MDTEPFSADNNKFCEIFLKLLKGEASKEEKKFAKKYAKVYLKSL